MGAVLGKTLACEQVLPFLPPPILSPRELARRLEKRPRSFGSASIPWNRPGVEVVRG